MTNQSGARLDLVQAFIPIQELHIVSYDGRVPNHIRIPSILVAAILLNFPAWAFASLNKAMTQVTKSKNTADFLAQTKQFLSEKDFQYFSAHPMKLPTVKQVGRNRWLVTLDHVSFTLAEDSESFLVNNKELKFEPGDTAESLVEKVTPLLPRSSANRNFLLESAYAADASPPALFVAAARLLSTGEERCDTVRHQTTRCNHNKGFYYKCPANGTPPSQPDTFKEKKLLPFFVAATKVWVDYPAEHSECEAKAHEELGKCLDELDACAKIAFGFSFKSNPEVTAILPQAAP